MAFFLFWKTLKEIRLEPSERRVRSHSRDVSGGEAKLRTSYKSLYFMAQYEHTIFNVHADKYTLAEQTQVYLRLV